MSYHEDLERISVHEKHSKKSQPNHSSLTDEELQRLEFQQWRFTEKKFKSPMFGEMIELDKDHEYHIPESQLSSSLDNLRLDDMQLLGRSLSLASAVTVDALLSDNSRQQMRYESPSGNHIIHVVSFPSYKGTVSLQFHETELEKDEYLSLTIQEAMITRSGELYEYTRLNGRVNLHIDNYELNLTPNPRRSNDRLSYHYSTDDYGVSFHGGDLMGTAAGEFIEALSLYRDTQR